MPPTICQLFLRLQVFVDAAIITAKLTVEGWLMIEACGAAEDDIPFPVGGLPAEADTGREEELFVEIIVIVTKPSLQGEVCWSR